MTDQNLEGDGFLIVNSGRHAVRYELQISLRGGLKSGQGVISNGSGTTEAFEAGRAALELSDGRQAPVIIKRWSPGTEYSDFILAGALT